MENLSPEEAALEGWLKAHERELVEDLKTLVRIPSVSGGREGIYPFGRECGRVLDAAGELIGRYGLEAKNWDYYGISALLPGRRPEWIYFCSHLDVVPAGGGWLGDPFDPVERDGYLIGRGAQDNKGPAVAVLYLLRFLKEQRIPLDHGFACFLGCNEEDGMGDIPYFLSRSPAPALSLVSDCDFPVCNGEKGRLTGEFTCALPRGNLLGMEAGTAANIVPAAASAFLSGTGAEEARKALPPEFSVEERDGGIAVSARGLSAHAAFPEKSVSALRKLAAALLDAGLARGEAREALSFIADSFADFYGEGLDIPFKDEESGRTTHVGSMARCGGGKLTVTVDIRYAISSPRPEMAARLRRKAAEYGYAFEGQYDSPPYFKRGDDPVVRELNAIACDVLGIADKPYVMGGGTYARRLPNALGFGPGIRGAESPFGGAHQANEAQKIENLFTAIRIYFRAVLAADKLAGAERA